MPLFHVSAESASPVGRALRSIVVGAAALTAIGQTGCENRTTPIPMAKQTHPPNSRIGKLERVMERLKSALADAHAEKGSGVESQRKASYRLIRPADDKSDFKAEVTIVTRTKLAAVDPAAGEAISPKNGRPSVTGRSNKPAPAETLKPLEKKEVFVLVYEDDRWKLLTEPEGETEQLVFEYALDL